MVATIPKGMRTGMGFRIISEGHESADFDRRGNVVLRIELEKDPFFSFDNNNVGCKIHISVLEAATGATIEVPTLHGQAKLKIPAGTQPGAILRLKGKGYPKDPNSDVYGDQLVEVNVDIPRLTGKNATKANELLEKASYPKVKSYNANAKNAIDRIKDVKTAGQSGS
jgi:molecular chaperone DnaJ